MVMAEKASREVGSLMGRQEDRAYPNPALVRLTFDKLCNTQIKKTLDS